jgi:uroporphyrinogen decarboxylase
MDVFSLIPALWNRPCLPTATPDQVRAHVRERMEIFKPGGGFVFNQIHNVQADAPPANVVAMLDAAHEFAAY